MKKQQHDLLFNGVIGEYLRDLSKLGLLFAPLVALVISLFFQTFESFADFTGNFFKSLYIGEVVMVFCVTMSYLLATFEDIVCSLLKRQLPEHSDLFHTVRSVIFIVPGLFIAFKSLQIIAPFFGSSYSAPSFGHYKFGIVVGLGSIGFGLLLSLYSIKRTSDSRIRKLETEHLNAKVSALSAQMNPHLLFNALNTVAATIQEDPVAAEKMTVDLAGLYRKTLEATRTDFHCIQHELDLVRAYLTIEKARFGERLDFSVSVSDPGLNTLMIPTLLIQPLVENSVKHGITSMENGGSVIVAIADQRDSVVITVEDNGIGFNNSKVKGTGTGLENCRKRLELLYPGKSHFTISELTQSGGTTPATGTKVTILIPKQRATLS